MSDLRQLLLVQCEDNSYIKAHEVTRWFVTESGNFQGWEIRASMPGPQQARLIATRSTKEAAEAVLADLLTPVSYCIRPNKRDDDG